MDFALSPLKHMGGDILNLFYLAYDPEGWFLLGLEGL